MDAASTAAGRRGLLTAGLALPPGARVARRPIPVLAFPALAGTPQDALGGPWLATLPLPAGVRLPRPVRRAAGFPA